MIRGRQSKRRAKHFSDHVERSKALKVSRLCKWTFPPIGGKPTHQPDQCSSSLRNSSPYDVIAQDSSYATVDGTTHPHVSSNSLCEGTAQRPIRQALNDARLFDFFMIVHQTLQTYNSGSAYVSLSDWHGVECRECGDSIRDEDAYSCDRCERTMCCDCRQTCEYCCDCFCDDCVERCSGCDDTTCGSCLKDLRPMR